MRTKMPWLDLDKLKTRLLQKIEINENGCWIFTGSIDRGYGQISTGNSLAPLKAHVASWLIHKGDVPKGIWVLHRCNVKACCNPKHLYLGTAKDNKDDWRKDTLRADFLDEEERPTPATPSLAKSEFARKFPKLDQEGD